MTSTSTVPTGSYGVLERHVGTSDIDIAVEHMQRDGFCLFDGGFTEQQLSELSDAFDRVHSRYVQRHGVDRLTRLDELNTVRAPLVQGEPWLIRLASWPRLLELMQRLLAGRFILNQQNGVINPGGKRYNQGSWHRDLPYQHFVASRSLAVNALFCLDPFREDNGATFVLPASHRQEKFPSDAYVAREARQITAPAGHFIVLDAMTFHCGGVNRTEVARRAVNHVYAIPHIRQQIGLSEGLAAVADLTPGQRELFGLGTEEPRSIEEYLLRRESR